MQTNTCFYKRIEFVKKMLIHLALSISIVIWYTHNNSDSNNKKEL